MQMTLDHKTAALLPTHRWRKELAAGDTLFSAKAIELCESALVDFAQTIGRGGTIREALSAIELVMVRLNRLGGMDGEHGNFIETLEREELHGFLMNVCHRAGFSFDDDVTEQWREW